MEGDAGEQHGQISTRTPDQQYASRCQIEVLTQEPQREREQACREEREDQGEPVDGHGHRDSAVRIGRQDPPHHVELDRTYGYAPNYPSRGMAEFVEYHQKYQVQEQPKGDRPEIAPDLAIRDDRQAGDNDRDEETGYLKTNHVDANLEGVNRQAD